MLLTVNCVAHRLRPAYTRVHMAPHADALFSHAHRRSGEWERAEKEIRNCPLPCEIVRDGDQAVDVVVSHCRSPRPTLPGQPYLAVLCAEAHTRDPLDRHHADFLLTYDTVTTGTIVVHGACARCVRFARRFRLICMALCSVFWCLLIAFVLLAPCPLTGYMDNVTDFFLQVRCIHPFNDKLLVDIHRRSRRYCFVCIVFPHIACVVTCLRVRVCAAQAQSSLKIPRSEKGMAFVSRRSEEFRNRMITDLGKHYTVHSYGAVVHNTDWPQGHSGDKKFVMQKHKFCAAIENMVVRLMRSWRCVELCT